MVRQSFAPRSKATPNGVACHASSRCDDTGITIGDPEHEGNCNEIQPARFQHGIASDLPIRGATAATVGRFARHATRAGEAALSRVELNPSRRATGDCQAIRPTAGEAALSGSTHRDAPAVKAHEKAATAIACG